MMTLGSPKMTLGFDQKPIGSPKRASDWAKNWFEAQNEGRRTPKIDWKPKTSLGLHQKLIGSPRRGSFHAKNRI